ncbi:MAG: signal peptide peptidase SppA [Flavobacteriales bacterium]
MVWEAFVNPDYFAAFYQPYIHFFMSFGKQILSSIIGSTVAMLLTGGMLIVIFVAALIGGLATLFAEAEGDGPELDIEPNTVLRIQLNEPIVERGSDAPEFNLGTLQPELSLGLDQIQSALRRAATDDNIRGLVLNVSGVMASPATLQEIHEAIIDFREASGKFVISWTEMATWSGMYLASAAEEVYLHPNGYAEFAGMRLQTTFFKGMLEKLGVGVTVLRGPDNTYKSAVEPFLRENMSPANREQLTALLEDIWGEMRADMSVGFDMTPEALDDAAETLSLRTAEDGVNLGFFDGVMYEDELEAWIEERTGEPEWEFASLGAYLLPERFMNLSDLEALAEQIEEASENAGEDFEEGDNLGGEVAVVYAVGGIESGEGDDQTIGSETIAEALRQARLAEDIKAVVMRVNSPGGSALASDVIWRETELIRAAGKPFVVSMGDYAASGGYYISAAADAIFASPTTITGSIGVFGMIPHAEELLEDKMGLSYDEVSTHSHAGMGIERPLDSVQLEAMNESITDIYNDFISLVAKGRGMSEVEVDAIARGRVWTGTAALEIGLVDELGNLEEAISHAEELAGLSEDAERIFLPERKDPIEQFVEDFVGVELAAEVMKSSGISPSAIHDLKTVAGMLSGEDRFQARLPFVIHFQ